MAGGSAAFPFRPFTLYDSTTLTRQEVGNNRSLVHFEVWIRKDAYSPTWSGGGNAYARWGYDAVVRAETNPGSYDFRPAGPWLWLAGDIWVPHNSNGTKTITVNVGADFTTLGTAVYDYNFTLPTIARTLPNPPNPIGLDQITRTSMRYRFSNAGIGDGTLIRWEAQYSTSPTFASGNVLVTSPGTTVATGLKSGTVYYWRSRGITTVGTGPWSAVISARTLSGAYISVGGAWVPAEVLISDGTSWKQGEVLISDGTSWKQSG